MKKAAVLILCVVLVCCVLAGCGIKGKLIGKWEGDNGYVIEFKDNEDWIMYTPSGSIATLGEYTHGNGFVNLWIGEVGSLGYTIYILPDDKLEQTDTDYTDEEFPGELTKIE